MNEETGIEKLLGVMRTLRSPDGCPWDRAQTHKSLKMCTMEECAELLDAIEESNDAEMCEELGDILMHITLHSVIAEERGAFTFSDVVKGITEKMIRRHPHVFGTETKLHNASEVLGVWEKVKKIEKGDTRKSLMDGIPHHCPALLQAEKFQKRAAKVGFDWTDQKQIVDKIGEELGELREAMNSGDDAHIDEELGDLLFAAANLSRFRKRRSAEELLADASRKFETRFRYIESKLAERGKTPEQSTPAEMEELWQEAKKK